MKSGTDWLKSQSRKISDGAQLPVSEQEAAAVGVEAWLQGHGVRYAPPLDIPMTLIDEKRSRANQARRDAIVADSVDRFAAAMKVGAEFPPVVTYISGGKLTIIDGNNRQAAARKAGRESILGIVIAEDTPSELIQLLTVEANAHHGVTPELAWRIQQAFHLCSLGFTDPQAAQAAAVTISQLQGARRLKEADQRAAAMKIMRFSEVPVYGRQALGVLKDDAVFYQAAKVAIDTGMIIEEIRDMIRGIKAQSSEGARIEYIGSIAKERGLEQAARRVMNKNLNRVSSPKQALVTGIGKLLKVDEAALVRAISTRHDRDLVNQRLVAVADKILTIQVALEQLKDLEEGE